MSKLQLGSLLHYLVRRVAPAASGEVSDTELLERFARRRDEAAFELLVWRHGPMVLSVCQRLLSQEQDAEDAFQAAFMILARKARAISKRESLASWLYKVAYRVSCRARSTGPVVTPLSATQIGETLAAPDDREAVIWRDVRGVLDVELARLPETYRRAVVLCYLEGKTQEEAALALGWPKGTVATRLTRARERLRTALGRRGLAVPATLLATLLAERAAAAEVPAGLVRLTLGAAATSAAHQVLPGVVSTKAIALSEGVLRIMWLNKIKMAACVLLVLLAAGTGVGLGVRHVLAGQEEGAESPVAVAAQPDGQRFGTKSKAGDLNKLQAEIRSLRADLDAAWKEIRDLRAAQRPAGAVDPGPLYRGRPVSSWLEQARDGDPSYRKDAVLALGMLAAQHKQLVPELLPVLVSALQDRDRKVSVQASSALGTLGGAGVPRLLDMLRDAPSDDMRIRALQALGSIGPEARPAVPQLMAALTDASVEVRQSALSALSGIGPEAKVAVPLIVKALGDSDANVREIAVHALGSIGPDAKSAIPALVEDFGKRLKEIQKRMRDAQGDPSLPGKKRTGGIPGASYPGGSPSQVTINAAENPAAIFQALVRIDPGLRELVPRDDPRENWYADPSRNPKLYEVLKQRYGPTGK